MLTRWLISHLQQKRNAQKVTHARYHFHPAESLIRDYTINGWFVSEHDMSITNTRHTAHQFAIAVWTSLFNDLGSVAVWYLGCNYFQRREPAISPKYRASLRWRGDT